MHLENVTKEYIALFLEDEKISKIITNLNKYSDSDLDIDSFYDIMNVHSSYMNITNDEIQYWLDRSINLESDSELLIDFIFRIPFVDGTNEQKGGKIETIVEKVLKKVESLK